MEQVTNIPLSAGLAKRLAEAADGLRDDKYYYFLSTRNYPFDLVAVPGETDYAASVDADNQLTTLNNNKTEDFFEKFGPYRTESEYYPPGEYDSIEIRFLLGSEVMHTQTLEKDIDAIIINLSAFDKFFLPYYTRLYGANVAKELRETAKATFSSIAYSTGPHKGITLQIIQS